MSSASRLAEIPARRTFDRATVRLLLHARPGAGGGRGAGAAPPGASRVVQRTLAATVQQLRIDLSRLEEENRYLRDRLARIPPRERAHDTPVERFRILVLMRTHTWSVQKAAARFLVTPTTVSRWLQEAASAPTRRAVGTLLRAAPPVRRYADVVRDLVQQMDRWGFGGSRRIAQTLGRAGVRIGRETSSERKRAAARPRRTGWGDNRPKGGWLLRLDSVPLAPSEVRCRATPQDRLGRQPTEGRLAPQAGLEPATLRLTAGCSAIELLRIWSTPDARWRGPLRLERISMVPNRPSLVKPEPERGARMDAPALSREP
jgi:hypothetical protein